MKLYLSNRIWLALLLSLFIIANPILADTGDFNIDGIYEAALDLPRILFLLKSDPNGPALEYMDNFEINWAFLDTGASGILLSRETCDYLQVSIDPVAKYVDVGVGGNEFFDVSEPLYIGTIAYDDPNPYEQNNYLLLRAWRFQVNQNYAGDWPNEPIDLLGMPVMFGKTVILNSRGPSNLEYFSADIKEPNDPTIPDTDFTIPLRFEKYIAPKDPNNIPPLPVLGYNPVIDNITSEYQGSSFTGTWLLDTGATISLMSIKQAAELGLTDAEGNPLIPTDFLVPIGGIGGQVMVPGFKIDELIIPTLNGYKLVFNNARVGVHNIGTVDEITGKRIILDGVFGSNFLCATMSMSTWDLADTPFDTIVIDMQNGLLGFDVSELYPLPHSSPTCGDEDHPWPEGDLDRDCDVDMQDIRILAKEWLNDCNWLNWNCRGADLYSDNIVNFSDYAKLVDAMR